jgi:hypothetical protein
VAQHHRRARLALALLLAATLACGFVDDIRGTVNTVNRAVELLDDLEQNGTWKYVADGLDALRDQDAGYTATTAFSRSGDGVDNSAPAAKTIRLHVDGQRNALVQITEGTTLTNYFIQMDRGTDVALYEIDGNEYRCVTAGDHVLRNGVDSLFADAAIAATGLRLLSVVEKTDDVEVLGRDATAYKLVSKVPEARDIVTEFENADLQARLDTTGPFDLSGSLIIDDKTGALLYFESTYSGSEPHENIYLSFEITQWDGIPDIPLPTDAQIVEACPLP